MRDSRETRTPDDARHALALTRESFDAAESGYVRKPEAPFGLVPRK